MVTLTALALSALAWLSPAFAQADDAAPAHVVASLVLKVPSVIRPPTRSSLKPSASAAGSPGSPTTASPCVSPVSRPT